MLTGESWSRLALISIICCFCVVLAEEDTVTKQFQSILGEFWEWRLKNSPEFATATGDYRYNDKVDDLSISAFETLHNESREFLDRLNELSKENISSEQMINYDLLKDNLQTYVDGYEWRRFTYSGVSLMEGPVRNFASLMPFKTKVDFDTYIKRIEAYSVQIGQYIELMKESVKTGLTLHNASIKLVPSEIDSVLNENPNATDFYQPFAVDIYAAGLENATIDALIERGYNVINDKLFVALRKLKHYIANDYKTRSEIGVSSLPDGAGFYKACLKWHIGLDMTPEEVYQMGLREVARIENNMQKVMDHVKFKGTLQEFIAHLKNQTKFFYKEKEELLQGYRDIINKRILPVIPKFFNNPPQLPFRVVGSNFGSSASYESGSADGKVPGTFKINTRDPESIPKFDMMALSLHEVYPGHHMQQSYMMTGKIPPFRQFTEYSKYYSVPNHFPFFTAYTEGWGLYSEYVGEEMSVYRTQYELFGRYVSEMLRACRLVVDPAIHVKNWTYDRAVKYMNDHLTDPIEAIKSEVDRYITIPGQACGYKVGEQRILQLRSKAEKALGNKFDLKGFHDQVLTHGSLPLSLLDRIVDNWIENVPTVSGATSVQPMNYITLTAILLTSTIVKFLNN